MDKWLEWCEFWRVYTLLGVTALCVGVSGCQTVTPQQATLAATVAVAGNDAGVAVAGIAQPAVAAPAAAVGIVANGLVCGISAAFGGGC